MEPSAQTLKGKEIMTESSLWVGLPSNNPFQSGSVTTLTTFTLDAAVDK